MPTVNSIIRQTEMLGQMSRKFFKSDEAANDSNLISQPIKTNADFLKSDFGGQPALTTMVENYTSEKDNFQSNLKNAMDNLQKSADEVKNSVQTEESEVTETAETENISADNGEENGSMNISVAREPARNNISVQRNEPPAVARTTRDYMKEFAENYLQQDDDEQEESQHIGERQAGELSAVQNLVRDYNSAVEYLDEQSLRRNEGLTSALGAIGISVNDSGELSVDEKTLTEALQNDSSQVGSVMNGLAGQIDKEANRVHQQSENLFPSIADYANNKKSDRAETLYTARNLNTANHIGMRYNQFVMMNA